MVETSKKTKTTKPIAKKPVAKASAKATVAKKTTTKTATKAKKATIKKPVAKTTTKKPATKPATKSVVKKAVTTVWKSIWTRTRTWVKKASWWLKTAGKTVRNTTKKVVKKAPFMVMCAHNLNFIKRNFSDIFLLFKNFFHWNISKVLIFSWSVILWFLAIIPLLFLFVAYTYFSDVNTSMLINWLFNWTPLFNITWNVLLSLIVIVYFIIFSYSNLLLINVNNSYKEWKQLSFKDNDYFRFKKVTKFFNLTLLNIWILLIPVILFVILFSILIWISLIFLWDLASISLYISSGFNYLAIISFILLAICWLLFAYLYYRVIFSYFIFSDKKYYKEESSALTYVKESINKTKKLKKFFKFIVIIILFIGIISPINYIWDILESNWRHLNNYVTYLTITDEQKTHMSTDDLYYFEALKLEFNWLTVEEVSSKIKTNYIYLILFSIFNFLFLYWLFVMIFSSFYKRELV